ncbi:MAG: polysaccharide biosynthesis C-terminal domain-containing protein [Gammaproteobacteria bacterium]|nr:polysaccharide biosynthesis C-terminal domain-containing protein [Gammaproteobacteria bacterium]
MLTQIMLVLVAPKVLIPQDYVEFNLVMPLALLGASIVFGWLSKAIYRYVHDLLKTDENQIRQTVFAYFSLLSLVLLLVVIVTSIVTDSIYRLVPLLLIATGLKIGILGVFNAAENHKAFFVTHCGLAFSLGIFLGICAIGESGQISYSLMVYAILDILISLVAWIRMGIFVFPPIPYLDLSICKQYFIYGAPLVIHAIAVWVISLSDRYLLTFWEPTEQVASYILGYQLSSSIVTVPLTLMMLIFYPKVLRINNEKGESDALALVDRALGYYIRYIVLIAFLGCIMVIPFRAYFYPEYYVGTEIMVIIVVSQVVFGISPFLNKEYELNGKTMVVTKGVGLGAILNVGANLLMIPILGLLGAAIATFLASFASVLYLYRSSEYRLQSS